MLCGQTFPFIAFDSGADFTGDISCGPATNPSSRRTEDELDRPSRLRRFPSMEMMAQRAGVPIDESGPSKTDRQQMLGSYQQLTTLASTAMCSGDPCITVAEDTANKVITMVVSSFSPDGGYKGMKAFVSDFAEASSLAAGGIANGTYTKFLIDVRMNGGGYLTLGYLGAYCLSGDTGVKDGIPMTRAVWIARMCY